MIKDLWYKNAIVYCLSVGTYMDANGDGIGDFQGLMRRLDYLHGLGITAIWLMPFQTSPGKHNAISAAGVFEQNKIGKPMRQTGSQFGADFVLGNLGQLVHRDGQFQLEHGYERGLDFFLR